MGGPRSAYSHSLHRLPRLHSHSLHHLRLQPTASTTYGYSLGGGDLRLHACLDLEYRFGRLRLT